MLSNPNVSQIMPKVGNRYESALAIAKRARNIEARRVAQNESDIKNAVDIASQEIAEGLVKVRIEKDNKEEMLEDDEVVEE
jgi:DNA-directed RNA polymerase omega subunit